MISIYHKHEIRPFLQRFEKRRTQVNAEVDATVREIVDQVQADGDAALLSFAQKFDKVDLKKLGLLIPESELQQAHQHLDAELLQAIRKSRENIARFHSKSLPQSWMSWEEDGIILGQRLLPLQRVGVYVPGGRAAYPSSLLMGVIPAQVAGVRDIIVTTPCSADGQTNPTILAAAWELGIRKVYRIGGAQAIAAMAFGTESVPRVDKIVGPGNIYVATAKKQLYGTVGIDMMAGPSEVLVVADDSASPDFIAADLLAQAEHDPLASAILITPSADLAQQTAQSVNKLAAKLPRLTVIKESLCNFGGILVTEDLNEAAQLSNRLAPEHLSLHVEEVWKWLPQFTAAGAIFLGSYSPEAVGDYWAGPNHVLPTSGSARFSSPLRGEDFLRASSLIYYTEQGLAKASSCIETFAESEGLDAHAQSIKIRARKNA